MIPDQFTNVINAVRLRGSCLADVSSACYDGRSYNCRGIIKKYTVCYSSYSAKVSGGSIDLREFTRSGYIIPTKINYTEFFACLAPQMFSGLAYIEPISENSQEFNWMCLFGWESV